MQGVTLKELREINEKTSAEVAKVLGVGITAVSNYECGRRQISLTQVLKLAKLFSVNCEEIIEAQLNSCQLCR